MPCLPFPVSSSPAAPRPRSPNSSPPRPRPPPINLFLDSKYNPDADVERFLVSKFAHIRRRSGISEPWPEQPILDRLVDMSSGQFIVPSTIIRWVESGLPEEQLEQVLRLEWTGTGGKNPFAAVDVLYRHILKRAHNPDNDPHRIVNWILSIQFCCLLGSAGSHPASFWRQFP
ncbi:hypothetical protein FA13DRAFT_1303305 [Coprinellus micaceus]|uniref:Uncharacterized protein n=1 Tax=Coprinellus micaceus TaxID=71717 RepID=A0A4Y7SRQ1_COPMI|nr:hypothetical protein FA13DRAFT_1303305 [Coprinellus micaceus]